ncbi:DUF6930 domain-containing protein [Thiogranum longum]|nr:hypothetical protein [Thiogranum longum]
MLPIDPAQFTNNEAWLLLQLNDVPVQTTQDGDFNALAIMELSTGMIFGMEMVRVTESEMSEFQSRKLLAAAEAQAGSRPQQLFIDSERKADNVSSVATAMGISIERAPSDELAPLSREARDGFAAHISRGPP